MSKYKSGALPKMFKVIPSLPAWARMLALTHPENWTPHACRAATRIFISNMKPAQAQLFLEVVLLDAIREDIQVNKKLNVQYYECLKRALYKPGAFFKAIIFPMLDVRSLHSFRWIPCSQYFQSGCTLKEAAIIASVLAKNKVPVVHSSAALMRIVNMDYSGMSNVRQRTDILTDLILLLQVLILCSFASLSTKSINCPIRWWMRWFSISSGFRTRTRPVVVENQTSYRCFGINHFSPSAKG